MLWIALGFAVLLATLIVGRDLVWLRRYKYTWALLGLALVAATLVFGRDPNGSGVRLWFQLGPLQLPAVRAAQGGAGDLPGRLPGRQARLADRSTRASGRSGCRRCPTCCRWSRSGAWRWCCSSSRRDLGSALLFFGIFLAMLYVATGSRCYVVGGLIAFVAGAFVMYQFFDIVRRGSDLARPMAVRHRPGYQIVQALYAYATGGVLGTGFGSAARLDPRRPYRLRLRRHRRGAGAGGHAGLVRSTCCWSSAAIHRPARPRRLLSVAGGGPEHHPGPANV